MSAAAIWPRHGGEPRLLYGVTHPRTTLTMLFVLGLVVARQSWYYSDRVLPYPRVWSVAMLVGAVCALATMMGVPTPRMDRRAGRIAAKWPAFRRLVHVVSWKGWHALSGAIFVSACWLRAVALTWAQFTSTVDQDLQLARWNGVALWLTVGVLTLIVWNRSVIPWHVRMRTRWVQGS